MKNKNVNFKVYCIEIRNIYQHDRLYSSVGVGYKNKKHQELQLSSNYIQGSLRNNSSQNDSGGIQSQPSSLSCEPITFGKRACGAGCCEPFGQSQHGGGPTNPAPCAVNVGWLVSSQRAPRRRASLAFLSRIGYLEGNRATPPAPAARCRETSAPKDDGWLLARRM